MDSTTLIVIVIVVLLGAWLFNRFMGNRGPGTPTYDDKNTRSGGSIGGGSQRTNDDPNINSGGSIGGAHGMPSQRTNDDPNIRSGGSIGGSGVSSQERGSGFSTGNRPSTTTPGTTEHPNNPFGNNAGRAASSADIDELRNRAGNTRPAATPPAEPNRPSRSGKDDPNTRSGGSIGG